MVEPAVIARFGFKHANYWVCTRRSVGAHLADHWTIGDLCFVEQSAEDISDWRAYE
ncbi:hypothetical protein MA5S0921_2856 [Mycobacteroides abscessus 5S-0921]|uniref:Uncharacterized protein n=1 Tax=Mycobacteroides abscessus subsp. bolletii 1513 TaxID=1299321 RepID=X8E278_9MYCO|nr:hypothetical protein MA5S0921_2856 [Mycobacteroides abscessus 5S-0921]EUA74301.1 hypothetical protein I540_0840 [Mycobacteroides abscessus subsp. bolletii 1513]